MPQSVRSVLEGFVESARTAFEDDLRSVVLYGSAAEGRMRATSDINVIVILRRFDRMHADRMRDPYRFARSAGDLEAMFLLETEIDDAATDFAQKFADIARRRLVLYGDDPFQNLAVSRQALITRLRQMLLNLTIRLRELYVERSLREEQCAVTLAESAGPLRSAAAAILELEGGVALPPKEALTHLVEALERADLLALLPHISEARERRVLPKGEAANLLFSAAELARALHDRAKGL